MGNKRPHPDGESSGNGFQDGTRKRPKTNQPHKRKKANVDLDSLNAIKKRARAIERLLARDNLKLPANKQNELERELAAHKQRIEDAHHKKERSKMIQKYHMVRFFERKKALRFAKQLEKKVAQATDPEELAQLKADLHIAQVDIDYAIYYPFMEPYVSLYAGVASGGKDVKDEKGEEEKNAAARYLHTPRPPMWSVIEKTREEGKAALERLQNRRPPKASASDAPEQPAENDVTSKKPSTKEKKGPQQQERKAPAKSKPGRRDEAPVRHYNDESDSDSDSDSDGGGFFE
ncbi:hypothetical protein VTI74DRAFT_6516 [Chaetomium olivicolor]